MDSEVQTCLPRWRHAFLAWQEFHRLGKRSCASANNFSNMFEKLSCILEYVPHTLHKRFATSFCTLSILHTADRNKTGRETLYFAVYLQSTTSPFPSRVGL